MQGFKVILIACSFFCSISIQAQQKYIDSLTKAFNRTEDLGVKVDLGFSMWKLYIIKKDSINEKKIVDKVHNTLLDQKRYDLLAEWYQNIGRNTGGANGDDEYSARNILKGITYLNKGYEYSKKLSDSKKKWMLQGAIYRNIAFKYRDLENYSKSIDNQFSALQCYEKANDLDMILETYSSLAAIYGRAKDPVNSLKYAKKSLTYSKKDGFIPWEYGKKLNVLGNAFLSTEKLDSALYYFKKSLIVDLQKNDDYGISLNKNQIGHVFTKLNQFDSANVYLQNSLELNKNNNNEIGLGYTYKELGQLEFQKGNYEKALEYLLAGLNIFKNQKKLGGYSSILKSISDCYESAGNGNNALKYYKHAKTLDDSLMNKSIIKEVAIKEATFFYTKDLELSALQLKDKAVAIELLNKKNELQYLILRKNEIENIEKNKSIQLLSQQDSLKSLTIQQSKAKEIIALAESKRQKNIIWSVIIGLILISIFLILMVQRFKVSQQQKKIIEKQKVEVENQRDLAAKNEQEAKQQKQLVEEKNREILDSIEYAKRIQTAILPPPRVVKEFLKNSFILYLPKDIVAGDFYWMESLDEIIYFAACDCTGHGMPGAMVSVVCNNALVRSLNEFGEREPGKIFDRSRKLVLDNFSKSDEEVKDGMDASLCALNLQKMELYWAGANNPLWIFRSKEKQIQEIKADKQPIGKGYDSSPFTTHHISLNHGDIIYLFTDGYADQFGGEKNKKLTKVKFRNLLESLGDLPMEEQRRKLLAFYDDFRGSNEQVDDICVIGVQV